MNKNGKLDSNKRGLRRISTERYEVISTPDPVKEVSEQPEVPGQTVMADSETPEVNVGNTSAPSVPQTVEEVQVDNNSESSLEDDNKEENYDNEQPIHQDVSDAEKAVLFLSQLGNTPEEELLKTKLGLIYLGNRYKFTYCDDFSLEINQLIAELSMMPKKRKRLTREEKAKEIPIPRVERFPNVTIPKEYKKVLDKIIEHSNAPLSVLLRMILAEWFERHGLSIEDEE